MLIAAIRQIASGRMSIELSDGSAIRSTLGVVTDLRLYAGRELEEAELEELRLSSRRALARERALELLSRRPMSQKELREKLLQKGEDEDAAEHSVRWLCERGLLDDESYAALLVRHYAAKGYGAGRIRGELIRRGIGRELWDEALAAMPDQDDKLDKFIASRLKDPRDREQVRKISNALYRRGYAWEDIRMALDRYRVDFEDET